ncbi:hypothetical protein [Helicobacter felis]|uniref:Uncharacterized protein n=1 Tax=Helicobacter felis (strain ATCC 49179 / CCUG 28539 / NCTC 12436 / CS1) TaxID=936155 RepID=E7A9E4_HELFC|nr:hypothetical protein [Helicobacter felis]CBY83321.1 putative uncharacterized protein [Helicobacter felis ATCC 49179]
MAQSKSERDHHSNQCNPNNQAYRDAQNNRANQLNPNHPEYKGNK